MLSKAVLRVRSSPDLKSYFEDAAKRRPQLDAIQGLPQDSTGSIQDALVRKEESNNVIIGVQQHSGLVHGEDLTDTTDKTGDQELHAEQVNTHHRAEQSRGKNTQFEHVLSYDSGGERTRVESHASAYEGILLLKGSKCEALAGITPRDIINEPVSSCISQIVPNHSGEAKSEIGADRDLALYHQLDPFQTDQAEKEYASGIPSLIQEMATPLTTSFAIGTSVSSALENTVVSSVHVYAQTSSACASECPPGNAFTTTTLTATIQASGTTLAHDVALADTLLATPVPKKTATVIANTTTETTLTVKQTNDNSLVTIQHRSTPSLLDKWREEQKRIQEAEKASDSGVAQSSQTVSTSFKTQYSPPPNWGQTMASPAYASSPYETGDYGYQQTTLSKLTSFSSTILDTSQQPYVGISSTSTMLIGNRATPKLSTSSNAVISEQPEQPEHPDGQRVIILSKRDVLEQKSSSTQIQPEYTLVADNPELTNVGHFKVVDKSPFHKVPSGSEVDSNSNTLEKEPKLAWSDADERYYLANALLKNVSDNGEQADFDYLSKKPYDWFRNSRICSCLTKESRVTCAAGSAIDLLLKHIPWIRTRCDAWSDVYLNAFKMLAAELESVDSQVQSEIDPDSNLEIRKSFFPSSSASKENCDSKSAQSKAKGNKTTCLDAVHTSIVLKECVSLGVLPDVHNSPSKSMVHQTYSGEQAAVVDMLSPHHPENPHGSSSTFTMASIAVSASGSSSASVTDMDVTLFTQRTRPVPVRQIQDYNRVQLLLRQKALALELSRSSGQGVHRLKGTVQMEACRKLESLAPRLSYLTGTAFAMTPSSVTHEDLALFKLADLVKAIRKRSISDFDTSQSLANLPHFIFLDQLMQAISAFLDVNPEMSNNYIQKMLTLTSEAANLAQLFASQSLQYYISLILRQGRDLASTEDMECKRECHLIHVTNGLVLRDTCRLLNCLFSITPLDESNNDDKRTTSAFIGGNLKSLPNRLGVQIASDLHIETYALSKSQDRDQLLRTVIIPAAPVLALLGDIGVLGSEKHAAEYWSFVRFQAERFKLIIILTGNHEYYSPDLTGAKVSMHEINKRIHAICTDCGAHVVFLDRESIVVPPIHALSPHVADSTPTKKPSILTLNSPGVMLSHKKIPFKPLRISGCSLWSFVEPSAKDLIQLCLNDYNRIFFREYPHRVGGDKNKEILQEGKASGIDLRLLSVSDTTLLHKMDVRFIFREAIVSGMLGETLLVLTHHAPTFKDTSNPMYYDSPIRSAFASDLEWLMNGLEPNCVHIKKLASIKAIFNSTNQSSSSTSPENETNCLQVSEEFLQALSANARVSEGMCPNVSPSARSVTVLNKPISEAMESLLLNGDRMLGTSALHTWCSGHTHWSNVSQINGVRLVSNQHGYVDTSESTYDPSFVLMF